MPGSGKGLAAWGLAAALLPGCMAAPVAAPADPGAPAGAVPGAAARACLGGRGCAPAPARPPAARRRRARRRPPPPPPRPANLWSFLCPTAAQKQEWHQECQQRLCNSFIGKMLSAMVAPLRMIMGGSTTSVCAQLATQQGMSMPADSAQGAAARIQQEEAGVEARRQAIRYLGTCDCRYWPEAQGALLKGLRSDPNECVRYEAAAALEHGCCCNRAVMEALVICVSGSDKDGSPGEQRRSRVKAARPARRHAPLPGKRACAVTVAPVATPMYRRKNPRRRRSPRPRNCRRPPVPPHAHNPYCRRRRRRLAWSNPPITRVCAARPTPSWWMRPADSTASTPPGRAPARTASSVCCSRRKTFPFGRQRRRPRSRRCFPSPMIRWTARNRSRRPEESSAKPTASPAICLTRRSEPPIFHPRGDSPPCRVIRGTEFGRPPPCRKESPHARR